MDLKTTVTEQRGARRFWPGLGPSSTAKTEAESHRPGQTLQKQGFCDACNGLEASLLPKRKCLPLCEEVTGKQEHQVVGQRLPRDYHLPNAASLPFGYGSHQITTG